MAKRATSLADFVAQAQPISWNNRSDMLTEKWFEWPPDVFALSAMLLSHTGAYRRAVSPVDGEWPERDWQREASRMAEEWRTWVARGSRGALPKDLEGYRLKLGELRDVKIDHLYDPEAKEGRGLEPWTLCKTLLELLSISDQAMRGVGIGFAPRTTIESMDEKPSAPVPPELPRFFLQANVLLALRGSLSRLPKYRGVVLPKARTPQTGLTLRSFSNNLTFHHTEVDVAWRSFPWFNSDENTINIMIVPWPFEVHADYFTPISHPKAQSLLGPHRYFHYASKGKPLDVQGIVDTIRKATSEVRRIHVLVFPEMALREQELDTLQDALCEQLSPQQIPMIVTGTSARLKRDDPGEGEAAEDEDLSSYEHTSHAAGSNRVVLAFYYGEKWYRVLQDKHHRWKLDGRQIEQYQLGAMLTGTRDWWEAIQVTRRRLSVLAANTWLTICPLICEDLARLDPVSEVVRGIGPTLLIALLLDGPQLKERWSARYGSVFADDPGSSVLTVTSFGMSKRSRFPGVVSMEKIEEAKKRSRVVGLWKDKQNWHEIEVAEGASSPVKIVTIGAKWETEAAFDGRIDRESSAAFIYQGMSDHDLTKSKDDRVPGAGAVAANAVAAAQATGGEDEEGASRREDAEAKRESVRDMCELTLLTFYADALVDAESPEAARWLAAWFRAAMGLEACESLPVPSLSPIQQEIVSWSEYSRETRDLLPKDIPTPQLVLTVAVVTDLAVRGLEEVGEETRGEEGDAAESAPEGTVPASGLELWMALKDRCMAEIARIVDELPPELEEDSGAGDEAVVSEGEAAGASGAPLGSAERLEEWLRRFHVDPVDRKQAKHLSEEGRGRLMLSAPLAILWAVHVRLTTRRRYGVLSYEGARLLEEIAEFVDQKSGHKRFIRWKNALATATSDTDSAAA